MSSSGSFRLMDLVLMSCLRLSENTSHTCRNGSSSLSCLPTSALSAPSADSSRRLRFAMRSLASRTTGSSSISRRASFGSEESGVLVA